MKMKNPFALACAAFSVVAFVCPASAAGSIDGVTFRNGSGADVAHTGVPKGCDPSVMSE